MLNGFFVSQTCLIGSDKDIPPISSSPVDAQFADISTTPARVYKALSSLKAGKAPGLDGITPGLLHLCARGISNSVAMLFNRSFHAGIIPSEWKAAVVTSVH